MTAAAPVALVTGAAGGIGSAVAAAFVRTGFLTVGLDRHGTEEARHLGLVDGPHPAQADPSGRYLHLVADVCDPQALEAAARRCTSLGPLVHLVGVAGGALPGETAASDPAQVDLALFRASLEGNLVSQFATIRTFLPLLRRAAPSYADRTITVTSSVNALVGMDMVGYTAAKAGLVGMVRVLAKQLGPEGIRVNAVAPGTVPTSRTRRAWQHDPEHFERLTRQASLGRLTTAEDVARTVAAVATALGSVTGQTLVVDAGQTSAWWY